MDDEEFEALLDAQACSAPPATVVCPHCDGDRFFRLGDDEDDTIDCGLCAGTGSVVPVDEDETWRDLTEDEIRIIRDA